MYRIKAFSNAQEFQELFGIQEHGNGIKSRRNKILLSFLKSKSVWEWCRENDHWELLEIKSMAQLKKVLTETIAYDCVNYGLRYVVKLNGTTFRSNVYETDSYNGIPEDGTVGFVRYINHSNNSGVFKMRAGKFYGKLINETSLGKALPQQVTTWLCEEFSADWQIFCAGALPKFNLHIGEDFERIYSSSDCAGNFGSCMVDKELHYFYEDSVKAKAAYLTNSDDKVIARCIIFSEVYDQDGKVWRLAERQYATDGNEIMKRALIDALIKANAIDGYKQIGAGCGDARSFVDVQGHSLSDKKFMIECDLGCESPLSYQDSFKYYSMTDQKAYNHRECNYVYELDTTEGSLEADNEDRPYDSWHDRGADEVTTVFYHGDEETCDVYDLDDFEDFGDEYYHPDDLTNCPECGERMFSPDYYEDMLFHSDLTDGYYCCENCLKKAELAYKKENWFWCDMDLDYVEDEDTLTTYQAWNEDLGIYLKKTVKKSAVDECLKNGKLIRFDGTLYDKISMLSGLPFNEEFVAV